MSWKTLWWKTVFPTMWLSIREAERRSLPGELPDWAAESLIADCEVNTGDSLSARIQGGGYVGGIVGFQNSADIFNTHVMGTIGGSGSQSIGGITGKYASGKMKVARFEGTMHLPAWKCGARGNFLLELMILASTSVMGLRTERMWRTCSRIQRRRLQSVSAAQVSRMTIGSPTMPYWLLEQRR